MQTFQNPYLRCLKSDGTVIPLDASGKATLEASSTYYFVASASDVVLEALHQTWANSLVLTSSEIETSNLADADATWADTDVGDWVKEAPTTSYVAIVGTGITASSLTLSGTASSVGGAMMHLGNLGARRVRVKVVTGGTGGTYRVAGSGKR